MITEHMFKADEYIGITVLKTLCSMTQVLTSGNTHRLKKYGDYGDCGWLTSNSKNAALLLA
jgi:hypothetical protein